MAKILFVEDDPEVSSVVCDWLAEHDKHTVSLVENGQEGLERTKIYTYDLLIVDWQLPGLSGVELCQQFRQNGGTTPVIMLTGRNQIENKEEGFDSGADDYITKPFDLRELSVRVRAALRRQAPPTSKVMKIGSMTLDTVNFKFLRGDDVIQLTPREFDLLHFFVKNPDTTFNADQIMTRIWADESEASPDTVRVHLKRLRDKIDVEGQPSLITTIHRVGYRFDSRAD